MNAKKHLQKIRLYDTRINAKLNEIQHLRMMVTKITPTMKDDAGSGGGSQDKLGNMVARIVDLENELNHDIDAFVDVKQEITGIIDKVDNFDQFDVLHKRYVLYEPWEQIACEMHMTYRNVCYIHSKALQTVSAMLEGVEHGN